MSAEDPHIAAFWQALRAFTPVQRRQFLRFVWARSRLPATPGEFKQKFKIQSPAADETAVEPDKHLPKAHTCFFSLSLPRYSNAQARALPAPPAPLRVLTRPRSQVLRERLLYAIANCQEMDADFRLADNEMTGWDDV